MGTFTVRPEGIIRQPALTMPGNATGSEAACTALTGSQIRAICGLGTTDNVTFNTVTATTSVLTPLVNNASAALTLGNSTYGVTVPGVAYFGSPTGTIAKVGTNPATAWSILGDSNSGGWGLDVGGLVAAQYSRLAFWTSGTKWVEIGATGAATFSGAVSCNSLGVVNAISTTGNVEIGDIRWIADGGKWWTLGYGYSGLKLTRGLGIHWSPYGSGLTHNQTTDTSITSPSVGLVQVSGDISMSKTSAQGYIRAYWTDATKNAALYHDGNNGILSTSSGYLDLRPANGIAYVWRPGNTASFQAFESSGNYFTSMSHNSTNGVLSTNFGNLNLVPTGGTVAVTGAVTATGEISMQKATQGYIRAYAADGVQNVFLWHDGSVSRVSSSSGRLTLASPTYVSLNPATGMSYCFADGVNSEFLVYNLGGNKYTGITHDNTNGILSTSSGNLNLVPTGGTVAVTGGITASGAIQETYRTSSLDPTVSDIGSGKRQGWYNTTATEFRDWVNVGGTLYKSATYT